MPESIQIDSISEKPFIKQIDITELKVKTFSIIEPERSSIFNTKWLSSALTALDIIPAIGMVFAYKYKIKQRPQ